MENENKNQVKSVNNSNDKLLLSDVSDSKWKRKFWIPYISGFLIIPGEKTYLDSDFYRNKYLSIGVTCFLFIIYHCFFVVLPLLLFYYH